MKWIIVTVEWCVNKGIIVPEQARRSLNGSKVILHHDFIKPVLKDGEQIKIYDHDSPELSSILSGSEWCEYENI